MARGPRAGLRAPERTGGASASVRSLRQFWTNAKCLPESEPPRPGGQANSRGQRFIHGAGFARQIPGVRRKLPVAPRSVLGATPLIDDFRACIAGEREGLLLCGDHRLGDVMIEQNATLRDILVEEAHVGEPRCKELLVERCNRKLAHLQGGPAASVECQLVSDLQMPVAASRSEERRV